MLFVCSFTRRSLYFISVLIMNSWKLTLSQSTDATTIEGLSNQGNKTNGSQITTAASIYSLTSAQPVGQPCQIQKHEACAAGFTVLLDTHSNRFCFKLIDEKVTWSQARNYCKSFHYNSDLLVAGDGIMEFQITTKMVKVTKAWIGLARNSDGSFTWNQDSWPIGQPLGGYTNWAPGQPSDAGGHCGVLTSDGWQLVECGEQLPYVCMHEPEGDRARRIFQPNLSIEQPYPDNPKYLLHSSIIRVTCTFIEDRYTNDTYHRVALVGPQAHSISYSHTMSQNSAYEDHANREVCYFKRVEQVQIMVTEAMDKTTVMCLSKRYKQKTCPSYQKDCTQAGPFTVTSEVSALVPILRIKATGNKTRPVFVGEDLTITCKALVGATHKLEWRATAEGTPVEAKDLMISSDTKEGYSETTLKISSVRRDMNGLIVSCFNVQLNNSANYNCPNDNLTLCKESNQIEIRYGPKTPKLVVDYHKKPAVVYLGRSLTASCSANVGDDGYISWVWYKNDKYTLPELNLTRSGIVVTQTQLTETSTGVRTVQSYMTIDEVGMKHDGMKIACFSLLDSQEELFKHCSNGSKYCDIGRHLVVKEYKNETDKETGSEIDNNTYLTVFTVVGIILISLIVLVYFACCRKSKPAIENNKNSFIEDKPQQISDPAPNFSDMSEFGITSYGEKIGPDGKIYRSAETAI